MNDELIVPKTLSEALDHIALLEAALKPFAAHIGKVGTPVVLKIGADTWTDTLTGRDFANAHHVMNLRRPSYLLWRAEQEQP